MAISSEPDLREKGLRKNTVGLVESVIIGLASTAPAYSLAGDHRIRRHRGRDPRPGGAWPKRTVRRTCSLPLGTRCSARGRGCCCWQSSCRRCLRPRPRSCRPHVGRWRWVSTRRYRGDLQKCTRSTRPRRCPRSSWASWRSSTTSASPSSARTCSPTRSCRSDSRSRSTTASPRSLVSGTSGTRSRHRGSCSSSVASCRSWAASCSPAR